MARAAGRAARRHTRRPTRPRRALRLPAEGLTAPGRRRPTHSAPRLPAQGTPLSPKKRAKKPSLDSPLSGPGRLCQPHLLSIFIAFLAVVGMGGGGAAALLFKGLPAAAALPPPPSPPLLPDMVQLGCDFEVDTCVWIDTAPDGYTWTRRSGGTPSYGTGPSGDHTTGSGYYLYTEASSHYNKLHRLESPLFSLQQDATLSFFYHICLLYTSPSPRD